jgi:hypothetical protein
MPLKYGINKLNNYFINKLIHLSCALIMATYLTREALWHLRENHVLRVKVASLMGIDVDGVKSAAIRNSKSLTTYPAVLAIAEHMGKNPEEILEELPV